MPLSDPAFRVIFENAPVGIVVVDRDLKVVDVNAAYRKLRDEQGYWAHVEGYLRAHGGLEVSHESCPECARKGPA